jgi:hypothetical protein
MNTVPNIFILGAPKCGTTSVAAWLDQHQSVFMHQPKEPHSFDTAYSYPDKIELEEALINFTANSDALWRGEASTWYLRSPEAVDNILKLSPNARFIVCVRNPVDMAISLHNQFYQHGIEPEKDFWESWNMWESRSKGLNIPKNHPNPEYLNYLRSCALGEMAEILLSKVSRDRVLYLRLDEISQEPEKVFTKICNFLDIQSCEIDMGAKNEAIQRRSIRLFHLLKPVIDAAERNLPGPAFKALAYMAWKINTKPAKKSEIPSETRRRLGEIFDTEIIRLANATGIDLSDWRIKNGYR